MFCEAGGERKLASTILHKASHDAGYAQGLSWTNTLRFDESNGGWFRGVHVGKLCNATTGKSGHCGALNTAKDVRALAPTATKRANLIRRHLAVGAGGQQRRSLRQSADGRRNGQAAPALTQHAKIWQMRWILDGAGRATAASPAAAME